MGTKLKRINYAIIGYGNLGKACKQQIEERPDEFELTGVFSRRESKDTILLDDITKYKDDIDVALFCGGSSDDAPKMVPHLNQIGLSTVDSFDNHGEIANRNYLNLIQAATDKSGTTAIVGAGWDPGYLSIQRILNKAIMPEGIHHTFYGGAGGGLSMGHTNALKEIPGVITARQLTVTREDAIKGALDGRYIEKNDRHKRVCFVVAEPGKETFVEEQIRNMPGYLPLTQNEQLSRLFVENFKQFSPEITVMQNTGTGGSTDMGDVSQICPAIQPLVSGYKELFTEKIFPSLIWTMHV